MFNWSFFGRDKPSPEVADKEEPRPPTREEIMEYIRNKEGLTKNEIIQYLRNKQIVTGGARGMNVQLPQDLRRPTEDWDVEVKKKARKLADKLEDELDEIFGADMFYVDTIPIKSAVAEGQTTVYQIKSYADNEPLVEFHVPVGKWPDYVVRGGVKYEALKSLRDKALAQLRDPRFRYRWKKARADLKRMNEAIRRRGGR